MSDEKKQLEEEITPVTKENISVEAPVEETIEIQTELDKEDREELARGFSMDAVDEELPEEIKQKLEKNKQARAKKKLVKKRKKKTDKVVKIGRAYVNATYNNTMISLTDNNGDVISWASAGMAGFKGAKKATPYAAQIITKIACQKAKEEYGLEEVSVFVSGVGTGREAAIRALNANGLNVTSIKDTTPVPHNGCRPKKPRRV
jgi:small subunit ribosomal protein S11